MFPISGGSDVVELEREGKESKNAQAGRDNWHKAVVITSLYIERVCCVSFLKGSV